MHNMKIQFLSQIGPDFEVSAIFVKRNSASLFKHLLQQTKLLKFFMYNSLLDYPKSHLQRKNRRIFRLISKLNDKNVSFFFDFKSYLHLLFILQEEIVKLLGRLHMCVVQFDLFMFSFAMPECICFSNFIAQIRRTEGNISLSSHSGIYHHHLNHPRNNVNLILLGNQMNMKQENLIFFVAAARTGSIYMIFKYVSYTTML